MPKVRLQIEYDGTAYAGWQLQSNGLSVQQVVEEALARVQGAPVRLYSSGRTDAGVHARGMVAHFRVDRVLPLTAYREGVNHFLPADVAVRQAEEVPEGFHARYSARGKWYRYTLCLQPIRSPLQTRTSWLITKPLDLAAMRQATAFFTGTHDFAAFRSSGCNARTSKREIFSVELTQRAELLHIEVKGSGFLRNMVRIMVGTLVEIGQGKREAADIPRLLAGSDRCQAGRTAPAKGLCLMEVWY